MKNKKNVLFLVENGLSANVISKMTDNQVRVLVEKFKKSESNEQVTQQQKVTTTIGPNGGTFKVPPGKTELSLKPVPNAPGSMEVIEKEMTEDVEVDKDDATAGEYTQDMPQKSAPDGMDDDLDNPNEKTAVGVAESSINEKFESKAQQGLFWARCNKCSSKNCKWCKMAKEFSDSTSKKQYKDMPEKKHPEKTVKYKKKKTNENLEKFLEETFVNLVDKNITPKMSKKDLIETIKKKSKSMIIRRPKKVSMFSHEAPMELPIAKMFSIGKK